MGKCGADAEHLALMVAIREAVDLAAALPAFAQLACQVTGADICLVSLYDDIHNQLRCSEIHFPPEMEHLRTAYLRFVYPADSDNFRVFSSRTAMNVTAESKDKCSTSAQLAFEHWAARQMVIVPLTRSGHPICSGTLTLLSCGEKIADKALSCLQGFINEVFVLLQLHMHAEVGRERADSLRNAEAEIDGMLKFVAETSNMVDAEVIEHAVLKEFLQRFDMDIGGLWLIDGGYLRCVATEARSDAPDWVMSWRRACTEHDFGCTNARDAVISYVYLTGQPMMFGDVAAIVSGSLPERDKSFLSGLPTLQTLFLQPIRSTGNINGVLVLFSLSRKHAVSGRHQEQIGYWANFLGATLESAKTYSMLQSRSRELGERNEELAATLARLDDTHAALLQSKKLSALGSIVVAVAHELNTPIGNALTVSTTLEARQQEFAGHVNQGSLRRSVLENFLHESQQGSSVVTNNLQRAARIINDFKEIAIDRDRIARMPFDAGYDVQQIVSYVQSEWRQLPVIVEVAIEGDTRCESYHGPFCQVVTNLVANAFLHAFDGCPQGRLDVSLHEADSETLCLTVKDDGHGMPESDLDCVFDPFFVGGLGGTSSGLGLFVVHNMVNAVLGGRIEVDSALDRGTCFRVWLPKRAPRDVEESQFSEIARSSRRRHNRNPSELRPSPTK